MTELGRYLADELDRRGLTGEEFAQRSGMTVSHVYQLLRGERKNPRQDTLARLAAGLGIEPAELLAVIGDTGDGGASDRDLAYINAVWRTLPDHRRAAIIDLAKVRARRAGNSATASRERDSVTDYDYQTRLRDRQMAARLRRVAAPSPRSVGHVA